MPAAPTCELLAERIEHLRETAQLRQTNSEMALELQAKEYDRRLESLNHEAERLVSMQVTYWPREVAESQMKELGQRIAVLERNFWRVSGAIVVLAILAKAIHLI